MVQWESSRIHSLGKRAAVNSRSQVQILVAPPLDINGLEIKTALDPDLKSVSTFTGMGGSTSPIRHKRFFRGQPFLTEAGLFAIQSLQPFLPIAQMDRAEASDASGRRFKSCWGGQQARKYAIMCEMQGMKSIKEYMKDVLVENDEQDEEVFEAKLLSSPDEIDASNPIVKKLVKACDKYGYKLKKAFANINSKGKPSGYFTIAVSGFGAGYHPEILFNMNGKAGEQFYLRVDIQSNLNQKAAKTYSEGLAAGVAMIEVLNKIDGTKLPGLM